MSRALIRGRRHHARPWEEKVILTIGKDFKEMGEPKWTSTEIKDGKFKVTNGDITVAVKSNFSGYVESDSTGDFFEFEDLRDFIRAGKLLELALITHYGGAV